MNIEELFDDEIYHNYGMLTTDDANLLINYLKEEVMEYVDGLRQRITELDLRLGCCRDASAGKDLLITELEAQMPKEVKPDRKQHNSFCACGCFVGYSDRYCCQCGAKLDWRTS